MPLLLPCLADVGRARTELQKAFELGVLVAVGGGAASASDLAAAERVRPQSMAATVAVLVEGER